MFSFIFGSQFVKTKRGAGLFVHSHNFSDLLYLRLGPNEFESTPRDVPTTAVQDVFPNYREYRDFVSTFRLSDCQQQHQQKCLKRFPR